MLIKATYNLFSLETRVSFVDPLVGDGKERKYPGADLDLQGIREAVRQFMDDEPRVFKGSGWTVVPVDVANSCNDDADLITYWLVETGSIKELRKLAVEAP